MHICRYVVYACALCTYVYCEYILTSLQIGPRGMELQLPCFSWAVGSSPVSLINNLSRFSCRLYFSKLEHKLSMVVQLTWILRTAAHKKLKRLHISSFLTSSELIQSLEFDLMPLTKSLFLQNLSSSFLYQVSQVARPDKKTRNSV